jgi:hypothetical protein
MEYIEIGNMLLPYSVFRYFVFSVGFFLACVAIYFLYPGIYCYINLKKSRTDADNFVSTDSNLSVNSYLSSSNKKHKFPYRVRYNIMTENERIFYNALQFVLNGKYYVYPQVNLDKIIYLPSKDWKLQKFRNKIQLKSVDFAIFDKNTLSPLCAIELDDKSHERDYRKKRDDFVNAVFNDIGIPLCRVPAQSNIAGYSFDKIRSMLSQYLSGI